MDREASIKCKYCSHFEPGANVCHRGYSYDQSLDSGGGPYLHKTSPGDRCSSFTLPAMDVMAKTHGLKRKDGTLVLQLRDIPGLKEELEREERRARSGCYVATAVYGSYDCPQVWTLRRFRDDRLAKTWYGRAFIRVYYAVSPTLVRLFGQKSSFRKFWKKHLDKLVYKLNGEGVKDTPYEDRKP